LYIFAFCFVVNGVNNDHDDGFIEVHDPQALTVVRDSTSYTSVAAAAAAATADDDDDDENDDDDAFKVVLDDDASWN
jgi:hypothetical protein